MSYFPILESVGAPPCLTTVCEKPNWNKSSVNTYSVSARIRIGYSMNFANSNRQLYSVLSAQTCPLFAGRKLVLANFYVKKLLVRSRQDNNQ